MLLVFLKVNVLVPLLAAGLGLFQPTTTPEFAAVTVSDRGLEVPEDESDVSQIHFGGPFGIVIGPDGGLFVCETSGHLIRRVDLASGEVTTVAGNGRRGYSGDGGVATAASLDEPYEVRFDQSGNMFFVEMKNHVVRRVDAKTGVISTIAGIGESGFSGDGGPATHAKLHRPHSIALDERGYLYICDIGNHRVRRVNLKTGIIDTFAGTGEREKTPDGAAVSGTSLNGPRALDYRDGDLFLALREGNAVYRIDLKAETLHHLAGTGKKGYAGDGGPAKAALLSGPKGVSVANNGDIYLADTESHTIRVVRKATGHIETIAGTGKPGSGPDGHALKCSLNRPHGVFVDKAGRVFVGDSSSNRVRVIVPRKQNGGRAR